MNIFRTFLAPGQRYVEVGEAAWRADRQFTVVAIDFDRDGLPHALCSRGSGLRTVLPAAKMEAAVLAGRLVPVDAGHRTACAA